jgi:hypothetical protein
MSDLTARRFHDEDAAREFLEATRWPNGPVCPKCGTVGGAYQTKREGLYRCAEAGCRKDFTVTVGMLFERSHIKARSVARTRSLKRTKPTSAARRRTARTTFRRKRLSCRWSSAAARSARATSRT